MRVLITGITGIIGKMVALKVHALGHQVVGIDRRAWHDAPDGVEVFPVDIRKRAAEDVFRTHRPDCVIHMATVTHLTERSRDRYRINLHGTRAVFHHCNQYDVKQCVFVGRHTYYGAAHDAPLYHREDEPPMAVDSFPELSDLVAADLYAGSALWRYPKVDTAVLRICYTLGPNAHGTLAAFIRHKRVPTILGFDPLFQFMHEDDVAESIAAALVGRIRGVFNVAGPQPVPLSVLIKATGRSHIPVPERLFRLALGRFGLPNLPQGAVAHIKYPIVMDVSSFTKATGFHYRYDEDTTMRSFAEAVPVPHR